ncbi:MAG: HD domain-containing protein [Prevotella sp.]|nr:HD domain-containing protein [Prevotella sp.]
MNRTASLDLVEFVESKILPRYASFDKAHNTEHVVRVIRRAMELALKVGADLNMVYVIAAYHDLGMAGQRAVHHIEGGRILYTDARLKKWFSQDQLKIMKEAVEDHRASASRAPRSIYGKIVAEADRDMEPDTVFRRAVQFGLSNYPQYSKEEQWKRFQEHMENKYSVNGYIKLWVQGSENERNLNVVREIIANPQRLREAFERIINEELRIKS